MPPVNWRTAARLLERHYGTDESWQSRMAGLEEQLRQSQSHARLYERYGRTIGRPDVRELLQANPSNPLASALGVPNQTNIDISHLDLARRAYLFQQLQRSGAPINPRLRALADEIMRGGTPARTTFGDIAPELAQTRSGLDIRDVPVRFRPEPSGYAPRGPLAPKGLIGIGGPHILQEAARTGVDPVIPLGEEILHEGSHAAREAARGIQPGPSYFETLPEITARLAEQGVLGKFLRGQKGPLWGGAAIAAGGLGAQALAPDESQAGVVDESFRIMAKLMHEGKVPPQVAKLMGPLSPLAEQIIQNPSLPQRLYLKSLAGDVTPDLDIRSPELKQYLREAIEHGEESLAPANPQRQDWHGYVHPSILEREPEMHTRVLTGTTIAGEYEDVPGGRPSLLNMFPEVREALNTGRLARHTHLGVGRFNPQAEAKADDLYNSLGTAFYAFRDPEGKLYATDLYDFTRNYEHQEKSSLRALRDFIKSVRSQGGVLRGPSGEQPGSIDVNLQTIGNRVAKPFGIKWPLFAGAAGAGLGLGMMGTPEAEAGPLGRVAGERSRTARQMSEALGEGQVTKGPLDIGPSVPSASSPGDLAATVRTWTSESIKDNLARHANYLDINGPTARDVQEARFWFPILSAELRRRAGLPRGSYPGSLGPLPPGILPAAIGAGVAGLSAREAWSRMMGRPEQEQAPRDMPLQQSSAATMFGMRPSARRGQSFGQDIDELAGYGAQALQPGAEAFERLMAPINAAYEGLETGGEMLGRKLGGESGALLGRQAGSAAGWMDPAWLGRLRRARQMAAIGANRALAP